jgi:predicted negative regulator of RcsB-dependent stress response
MRPILRKSMSDVYLWDTYDKLGREALDSGDLAQANEAFRSAVATAEEIESYDRMVLSLRNLAATMMDMNQVSDAHELLVRTLDVANQHLADDHSQTIETQRDLAQVCQQMGYLDKADEMLKRVLEQELKSKETELIGSTLLSLARVAQARQEPAIAAAYLQRVVKLKRQQLGDDHPEVAQSILWLSTALYQCGKTDDAQRFMRKAFGLMERQFADEPAHLAQSLLAGAKMMVDSGQLEPALVHQKRALDILSSLLEPSDDKLWETREYIATTLAAMGKLEEAIEVLEFCFRNGDLQGPRAGATYKNLAGLYLALDKKEKAEELYEKASNLLETTLGIEHPAYLATQEERIQLYHFTGRTKIALEIALKTIKATEKRFGAGHPNTAQAYASTALLAHGVEEWETALELMLAAEKIWLTLTPRPEEVLANCRINMATCLIKLKRFDEADPILQLAEPKAGPALTPVIAELRTELETGRNQVAQPTAAEASAPTISEPPRPSLSQPPGIIIEPISEPESPNAEPPSISDAPPTPEPVAEQAIEEIDMFGDGIDLFDPDANIPDAEESDDLFSAEASQDIDDDGDLFGPAQELDESIDTETSQDDSTLKIKTITSEEIQVDDDPPEMLFQEDVAEPEATEELVSAEPEEPEPVVLEAEQEPAAIEAEEEISEQEAVEEPAAIEVEEASVEQESTAAEADEAAADLFDIQEEDEASEEAEVPEPVAAEAPADLFDIQEEDQVEEPADIEADEAPADLFAAQEEDEETADVEADEAPTDLFAAQEEDEEPADIEADEAPADLFAAQEEDEETADIEADEAPADLFAAQEEDEETADAEADEAPADLFAIQDEDEDSEEAAIPEPVGAEVEHEPAAPEEEPLAQDSIEAEADTAELALTQSEEDEIAAVAEDDAPPVPVRPETAFEPEFVERRANPRSPLSLNRFFDINVAVEEDDDSLDALKSFLVDLGVGGIRINSESPFPQDKELTLTLPEGVLGEEVALKAEVVWQKALYGASYIQGLAFKDLSVEQQELIGTKLNSNGPRNASRQHFRLYRPFPIKLQAAGQEEWQASYATDLSVNGLGTRLQAPLDQGNSIRLRLELEFELPTVEVEAKVAWSRSGENGVSHGLQFATVGPVEARTIKRYIDRCLDFLPD